MGLGKMGNLSQIVPVFSDFSPVSYQFHTFLLHSPQCVFGNFPQLPKFPHFPPFPPFSPFLFTLAAGWLIRLRRTPTPEMPFNRCALPMCPLSAISDPQKRY